MSRLMVQIGDHKCGLTHNTNQTTNMQNEITNSPTVLFSTVNREDRQRIHYPDIEELANSLYKDGFIHPISLNQMGVLIAGGRRSAALDHMFAHPDDYPYASAHPDMRGLLRSGELYLGLHFTLKQTASDAHREELELIENVQRENLTWQEECLAVSRIHRLKQSHSLIEEDGTWGQRETGRLLKTSAASVNYAVSLAKHLSDPDSPLHSCSNMTEALQRLASNKFDEANKMLVEKARARSSVLPDMSTTPKADDGFFSTFNPSVSDDGTQVEPAPYGPAGGIMIDGVDGPEHMSESSSETKPDNSDAIARSMVHNMDCIDFFKHLGTNSVDHVICDPPYGIDMSFLQQTNTGQQNIERVADTHDVAQNESDFKPWLQGCYDIMKDKGFCVWWCDVVQFENIKALAKEVGFKVQNWPLTWVKTSNCLNQRAEYNFTKNTEVAIVMRKGDARLPAAQSGCVWSGALTPTDKDTFNKHPFIKPDALWGWLLDAIALPGSVVADPFSGAGSFTLAAFKRGYQPVASEIDEVHYNQQVNNLATVLKSFSQ